MLQIGEYSDEKSQMNNEFMMSDLIIDEFNEDFQEDKQDLGNADTNKIIQSLELDLQKKNEFMQSEEYTKYCQIMIVSQITMNFTNDDPFFRHVTNVEKAIRKAVRKILIEAKVVADKQQFLEIQDNIFKMYYQDITIGFITSTGQIKSTAFIFMNNEHANYLHHQTHIQKKKNILKISLHFYNPNAIERIVVPDQGIKQSFMRNHKFYNEYVILKLDQQSPTSSLYHVYKPVDDQIYFVKRIQLTKIQEQLAFSEVFSQNTQKKEWAIEMSKIQEAKLMSRITHPNIIRTYDWWIEQPNNATYLFMQQEYCTYPGFQSQCKNLLSYSYFYLNPLPFEEKVVCIQNIMLQIISGLEYLQKRKIPHSDLKPENIMVTTNIIGETQVMLANFENQQQPSTKVEKHRDSPLRQVIDELPPCKADDTLSALGVIILHLVLTFPGEPTLRNNYASKFLVVHPDDVFSLFDNWATKHVRNRHKDFSFVCYKHYMYLAQRLLNSKIHDLNELKGQLQI